MIQANDLDDILVLLERQQVALASHAEDAADRLELINRELQRRLQRLLPLSNNPRHLQHFRADPAVAARIRKLLVDNRSMTLRLSDSNRRALQVLFNTEPLVYSRH